MLERLDEMLHLALDGYIDAQRLGWGTLQLWQWHVCNAYERRCWRGFESLARGLDEAHNGLAEVRDDLLEDDAP